MLKESTIVPHAIMFRKEKFTIKEKKELKKKLD
jgi:hypothetical protein